MEQNSPLQNPVIPPQAPVNPTVNSSSPNKRVLIILLVILLVTLSSLVTYLFVKPQAPSQKPTIATSPSVQAIPTPGPVADWKTYTNSSFGFSFRYPADWNAEWDNQVTVKKGGGNYALVIIPSNNSKHLSLKDYVTTAPYTSLHEDHRLTLSQFNSAENIFINTIPAIKTQEVSGGIAGTSENIYLVKNNTFLFISYPAKNNSYFSNSAQNYQIVQQILSTLKFTQ